MSTGPSDTPTVPDGQDAIKATAAWTGHLFKATGRKHLLDGVSTELEQPK